jgi:hypothetical protein
LLADSHHVGCDAYVIELLLDAFLAVAVCGTRAVLTSAKRTSFCGKDLVVRTVRFLLGWKPVGNREETLTRDAGKKP